MEILKHRVNSFENIDKNFGMEIDIRDHNGELVLSHDIPDSSSLIKLDDFLTKIDTNKLLALNIKSAEIEKNLKKIVSDFNLKNYFTFDWAIPSLIKAQKNNLICAFRLSEFEKELFPNCSWIWIDSFKEIWYDAKTLTDLKNKGFKLALVSPELHNRTNDLEKFEKIVNTGLADAICTDNPEYWYT